MAHSNSLDVACRCSYSVCTDNNFVVKKTDKLDGLRHIGDDVEAVEAVEAVTVYSTNISRENIFADFEVFLAHLENFSLLSDYSFS